MPGLVPGIHVFRLGCVGNDVDGRDKPGHEVESHISKSIRCGISGMSAGGIG
jgi:hypothetical protein